MRHVSERDTTNTTKTWRARDATELCEVAIAALAD